ncbi:hypothetical protein VC279_01185 [Xanthomonas sp. WHRI 10064A]|uniref:hypothetical protein n=1 Tax=unclassified Xanthomonas TaxID=2643310 RepID=UPI000E1E559F|nr:MULTISPECIES: hypothetical protein [unclassified Xanthomonas]MEA9563215.1 hypothetical protein [Xanthomonas sp. WHRI 8932A]MEA9588417.1 hypothetical protein [Xanthomonas sp. WHRI 10064B]MEA9613402.1 hypothetical protein [Xanthomonas sp. WHRI 10064A]
MSTLQLIPLTLVIAGFVGGAIISELSLRGVAAETKGQLLSAFTLLRFLHLLAIAAIVLAGFFYHAPVWWLLAAYFGMATLVAMARLRRLPLTSRLRNLQVASVFSVFASAVAAASSHSLLAAT